MAGLIQTLVSRGLFAALVLALVVRGVVPIGTMLVRGDAGTVTIALCSAHSESDVLKTVTYKLPPSSDETQDDENTQSFTCPFSLSVLAHNVASQDFDFEDVAYSSVEHGQPQARAPPVLRAVLTPVSPRAPPLHV